MVTNFEAKFAKLADATLRIAITFSED